MLYPEAVIRESAGVCSSLVKKSNLWELKQLNDLYSLKYLLKVRSETMASWGWGGSRRKKRRGVVAVVVTTVSLPGDKTSLSFDWMPF